MHPCNNQPRPVKNGTYPAQDGWLETVIGYCKVRIPRMVEVTSTMTISCKYDKQETDGRCAGCAHIGVDYDKE